MSFFSTGFPFGQFLYHKNPLLGMWYFLVGTVSLVSWLAVCPPVGHLCYLSGNSSLTPLLYKVYSNSKLISHNLVAENYMHIDSEEDDDCLVFNQDSGLSS